MITHINCGGQIEKVTVKGDYWLRGGTMKIIHHPNVVDIWFKCNRCGHMGPELHDREGNIDNGRKV